MLNRLSTDNSIYGTDGTNKFPAPVQQRVDLMNREV
jgi:hypothetical protein